MFWNVKDENKSDSKINMFFHKKGFELMYPDLSGGGI
jgi:hypothetical protein